SMCGNLNSWDNYDGYHEIFNLILCIMLIYYIARNAALWTNYKKNFLVIVIFNVIYFAGILISDAAYRFCGHTIEQKTIPRIILGFLNTVMIYCVVKTLPSFILAALLCLRFTINRHTIIFVLGIPIAIAMINLLLMFTPHEGYTLYIASEYLISCTGFMNLVFAAFLIKEGKVKSSSLPLLMVIYESIFFTLHAAHLNLWLHVADFAHYHILNKAAILSYWVMSAASFVVLQLELRRSKKMPSLLPSFDNELTKMPPYNNYNNSK
ncbi:hypothetical protein PFISCL1PPCAC_7471, partial [Pristionchus fissidentatus]